MALLTTRARRRLPPPLDDAVRDKHYQRKHGRGRTTGSELGFPPRLAHARAALMSAAVDEGRPIAYGVLEHGIPVYASDGEMVGTVDHVIATTRWTSSTALSCAPALLDDRRRRPDRLAPRTGS